MIKIFKCLIIQLSLLSFFFCGVEESPEVTGPCLPPELIIMNNSGYTAKEVYMHDKVDDYLSGQLLITDMPDGGLLSTGVTEGLVKYFTFVRNITATSTNEIAVTTANPVTFNSCYKYTLNLLAEDFFLEDSGNYAPADQSEGISKE